MPVQTGSVPRWQAWRTRLSGMRRSSRCCGSGRGSSGSSTPAEHLCPMTSRNGSASRAASGSAVKCTVMRNDERTGEADAAAAFEQLRREVSLLRRGVEALTAERQAQPDYTVTLLDLDRRLEEVRRWARTISERPALELTPAAIANQIEGATAQARDAQAKQIAIAGAALRTAADQLGTLHARVRSAREQRRLILLAAACSLVAGATTGFWLW
jgi:hypothetical protein